MNIDLWHGVVVIQLSQAAFVQLHVDLVVVLDALDLVIHAKAEYRCCSALFDENHMVMSTSLSTDRRMTSAERK